MQGLAHDAPGTLHVLTGTIMQRCPGQYILLGVRSKQGFYYSQPVSPITRSSTVRTGQTLEISPSMICMHTSLPIGTTGSAGPWSGIIDAQFDQMQS